MWAQYWVHNVQDLSSDAAPPLIFCIHVRLGPIYWGYLLNDTAM